MAKLDLCRQSSYLCSGLLLGTQATGGNILYLQTRSLQCLQYDASNTTKFDLAYPDQDWAGFQQNIRDGSLAAVVNVSGVPADNITAFAAPFIVSPGAAASSAAAQQYIGRRLRQVDGQLQPGMLATYLISSSTPSLVKLRLLNASANGGAGMYSALQAQGINDTPGMFINNQEVLAPGTQSPSAGPVAPAASPAPVLEPSPSPSPASAEESGGLSGGAIAGIVIGCVVGVALLAALLWCCFMRRKPRHYPEELSVSPNKPVDIYPTTRDQADKAASKPANTQARMQPGADGAAAIVERTSDTQHEYADADSLAAMSRAASARMTPSPTKPGAPTTTFRSAAAAGGAAAAALPDTSLQQLQSRRGVDPAGEERKAFWAQFAVPSGGAAVGAGAVTATAVTGSPARPGQASVGDTSGTSWTSEAPTTKAP